MTTLTDLHQSIGGELKLAAGSARNPGATCLGPVVTDSRRIDPGDVFWALRGPRYDGNDFTQHAFLRGAAGAVVGRLVTVPQDRWIIRVDDTRAALLRWAARTREQFRSAAIAVAGGVTVINDDDGADPASVRAAFEVLRDFDTAGRRIIVSGDVADWREEAERLHYGIGTEVVTAWGADLLIACGRFAYEVVTGARAAGMPRSRSIPCKTPEDALAMLGSLAGPGDVVLVRRARRLTLERVVEALQEVPRRRSA